MKKESGDTPVTQRFDPCIKSSRSPWQRIWSIHRVFQQLFIWHTITGKGQQSRQGDMRLQWSEVHRNVAEPDVLQICSKCVYYSLHKFQIVLIISGTLWNRSSIKILFSNRRKYIFAACILVHVLLCSCPLVHAANSLNREERLERGHSENKQTHQRCPADSAGFLFLLMQHWVLSQRVSLSSSSSHRAYVGPVNADLI